MSVVFSLTAAASIGHAAPWRPVTQVCFACRALVSPPVLQGIGYDWYGGRELDIVGGKFTPYTHATFVLTDTVTGQVIRTDSDPVGEAGALISIGRDGGLVDGALIYGLRLDSCGAYSDPRTGNYDQLSVQAFDASTGLGSNVLLYQSACL
jgi:hypothetical protein